MVRSSHDTGREVLEALEGRKREGESLEGLRFGTAILEGLTELASRGLVELGSVERDGDAWKVDVELVNS